VLSPFLGFVLAFCVFSFIHSVILSSPTPKNQARLYTQHLLGGTCGVLTLFLTLAGPQTLRLARPYAALVSALMAVGAALAHRYRLFNGLGDFLGPNFALGSATTVSGADLESASREGEAEAAFAPLMVLTACVVAFAHGSNDVSNAVGPVSAVIESYYRSLAAAGDSNGVAQLAAMEASSGLPLWLLMLGGLGIVLGLATFGHQCMETLGKNITPLTFSRGFAAQIATAATVLSATCAGLSVSTTHCLVGAITGVALVDDARKVNARTLWLIGVSWVVTMPASAAFSLAIMWLMPRPLTS
jgi:PiT family inorganic phosphate transporter